MAGFAWTHSHPDFNDLDFGPAAFDSNTQSAVISDPGPRNRWAFGLHRG
jgi:hypothetical protein